MTTLTLQSITSNKRAIALFVLLLLSSVGMFGQQVENEIVRNEIETTQVADNGSDDAQLELISWFMGSKQTQVSNAGKVSHTISTNNTGKKNYINCGMTPNRILSRAFLKKAINHDSTVA